jgi:hypothetical protein
VPKAEAAAADTEPGAVENKNNAARSKTALDLAGSPREGTDGGMPWFPYCNFYGQSSKNRR